MRLHPELSGVNARRGPELARAVIIVAKCGGYADETHRATSTVDVLQRCVASMLGRDADRMGQDGVMIATHASRTYPAPPTAHGCRRGCCGIANRRIQLAGADIYDRIGRNALTSLCDGDRQADRVVPNRLGFYAQADLVCPARNRLAFLAGNFAGVAPVARVRAVLAAYLGARRELSRGNDRAGRSASLTQRKWPRPPGRLRIRDHKGVAQRRCIDR